MFILTKHGFLSLSESSYKSRRHRIHAKSRGKVATESKHRFVKIKEEPLEEKAPSRKHLAFQEASSSMIKSKLEDRLGRVPWSNYPGAVASYADGVGSLSQQRLQAIMNQLTNDIRVNGRRVTPLQAQIVQQSSNGEINPTSPLNDMQNDMLSNMQDAMQPNMQDQMHDDMQSNKPNGMQNDMDESQVKPIQIPMNHNGGNNAQLMSPNTFERLMFGGLSQIVGGEGGGGGGQHKGFSDFGGGMSNVPGLSFGGRHNSGVINLMESENGLKPMTGMNEMRGTNGMFVGGMHGMMNGMGRMRGRMWGGGSFFSRRGETTHTKKWGSKHKVLRKKTDKTAPLSVSRLSHRIGRVKNLHVLHETLHGNKPNIIRLIPSGTPSDEKSSSKAELHQQSGNRNAA